MYCGRWKFNITDFPGEFAFDATADTDLLRKASAVVYVHDAQQNPKERSAQALIEIMQAANQENPDIFYTVFIHKVDSDMFNSEEQRDEVFNEFSMYMRDQLRTADINVQIAIFRDLLIHVGTAKDCAELREKIRRVRRQCVEACKTTNGQLLPQIKG